MPLLTPYALWPDLEKTVVAWLRGQLPDAKVVTETGTDLADLVTATTGDGRYVRAGVVQVLRVPGGGTTTDRVSEDALVDVYCFAADRGRMWTLARRAHAGMLRLDAQAAAGGFIDTVDVYSAPGDVPYGDVRLRRSVASYSLVTRAQATA